MTTIQIDKDGIVLTESSDTQLKRLGNKLAKGLQYGQLLSLFSCTDKGSAEEFKLSLSQMITEIVADRLAISGVKMERVKQYPLGDFCDRGQSSDTVVITSYKEVKQH